MVEVPPRNVDEARARIGGLAESYMLEEMGFLTPGGREALAAFRSRETPLVETAHTPHFPSIGAARVLFTGMRAARELEGVHVHFINDHLPARLLAESRYVPVYHDGVQVADCPRFGPGKLEAKYGMNTLPPPSGEEIEGFMTRLSRLLPSVGSAIDGLTQSFQESRLRAKSYSGWLMRGTAALLGMERTVFVPTSQLVQVLTEAASRVLSHDEDHAWIHCGSCGYRIGRSRQAPVLCSVCGSTEVGLVVPDVEGRQAIVSELGIDIRVSGRSKPYHLQADQLTRQVFDVEPTTRMCVAGRTAVRVRDWRHADAVSLNSIELAIRLGVYPLALEPPLDPAEDWMIEA